MKPIRLLIHGGSGRMGRALTRLSAADPSLQTVAVVSRSPIVDLPPGLWIGADALADAPPFDVAIDFSLPNGVANVLALCRSRGAALVSGTTGLNDADQARLDSAGAEIAWLWAANFSIGVTVLRGLVERAASALSQWDVDIVELHHHRKIDAPSGTALLLGAAVNTGNGKSPTFHSLRAGDAVGEHSIQFSGAGERLELIHRAYDRDVFARGALFAARWLASQRKGKYRLEDALQAIVRQV
ncbi:MAG: 4-hydroxy-tetrahydrodipicolinate reductase [Pseudomarimonas sp.]